LTDRASFVVDYVGKILMHYLNVENILTGVEINCITAKTMLLDKEQSAIVFKYE
jgi:hypothetical protein